MRAAVKCLILLVAALLALLRWNYNGTLEAESALAHAKLREDNLAREQEREDNRKLTLRAELTTNANLKLQLELTTLKARGEECKLQAAAQQQELQVQLEAAREQSRTQHIYAPSTAAASTAAAASAAASTSPLEANLARSQPAASTAAAASSRVAWVPANSSAAAAHAALESEPLLEVHRHWDWASIAKELLFPFESIDKRMLREGIKSCFDNGTMYPPPLPPPPPPPPPPLNSHAQRAPPLAPTHAPSSACSGTVSAFKSRRGGSTSPTTGRSSSTGTTRPPASCRC